MQIQITVLSLVLALSTLGFGHPPHTLKSSAIGREAHQEDPLSDLHTVSVLKTTLETVRVPASSMCLHTHTVGSDVMTHTRPCSPKSMPLAPHVTSIIRAAATKSQPTGTCTQTYTQNGSAFFTATVPCSHTNVMGGPDAVHTEMPFAPNSCGTEMCDYRTSTITAVNAGITSLSTTTTTINRACLSCSLVNETNTISGLNTITYTTEVWRTNQTGNAAPQRPQTGPIVFTLSGYGTTRTLTLGNMPSTLGAIPTN
ncbi:hypothetical protein DL98DRAFT_613236 [Cadophora sp. DSE1049]|nr:hypothetical protein DL98DRAFT_613236 [Cadophora sp. DSE1049]